MVAILQGELNCPCRHPPIHNERDQAPQVDAWTELSAAAKLAKLDVVFISNVLVFTDDPDPPTSRISRHHHRRSGIAISWPGSRSVPCMLVAMAWPWHWLLIGQTLAHMQEVIIMGQADKTSCSTRASPRHSLRAFRAYS